MFPSSICNLLFFKKNFYFYFILLYNTVLVLLYIDMNLSQVYMSSGVQDWELMSLLFNMLSRLVITFLPRSKHLLISWLQSPSVVILEPPKIKSATISPSICHEVMGPDAMIFVF